MLQAMRRDHAKKRESGRPMHEAIMGKLNNDPDFLEHGFAVLDDPYGRDVGPDVRQLVLWAANHIGWERLQANAVRYLKALELDLGDLGSESVVVWQNREKHRSIPQIPHCHVYIKTRPQPHFKRPQPRASQGAAPSEGPTPRAPETSSSGGALTPPAAPTLDSGGATGQLAANGNHDKGLCGGGKRKHGPSCAHQILRHARRRRAERSLPVHRL